MKNNLFLFVFLFTLLFSVIIVGFTLKIIKEKIFQDNRYVLDVSPCNSDNCMTGVRFEIWDLKENTKTVIEADKVEIIKWIN